MGYIHLLSVVLLALISITSSKPIMVSFGTNQGPIVPRTPTTTFAPKIQERRSPAPVFEYSDDIPNPSVYKPAIPRQYRKQIYSYKPNPNLILGTALDRKYTPGLDKYSAQKRTDSRALGLSYTGPQFFEKQAYEVAEALRTKPKYQYHYHQQQQLPERRTNQNWNQNYETKSVPQIGVVYSSGVRYYVPQIVYVNSEVDDNSVYDNDDTKYYHYNKGY